MRILHICNHVKEIGNGIVNVTIDLACAQKKAGHTVAVVSQGGAYEELLARFEVAHFCVDQTRRPVNIYRALKRYGRTVRQFQPDIVHAHMMTGATIAYVGRRRYPYGLVTTVHNSFKLSSIVMGLGDRVIVVSAAVAETMAKRGIRRTKLRIVQNGTLGSPRLVPLEQCPAMPLRRPAIITIAGLYYRKGIDILIKAFERVATEFPIAHLYIVGDGPDRPAFENMAKEVNGSERIHFEGFRSEPQAYLKSADVFVLASRSDPSPLVIPEAREAGVAIIGSEVDGIPEALEGGKAGLLVPAENVEALAAAMRKLLSDPNELQEWHERARRNISWLSVTRVAEETTAVYQELLLE